MGQLSKHIRTTNITSKFMIDSWNSAFEIIKRTVNTGPREITPQLAEMYKFDLEGLFRNEFGIPKEMIYPNIKLNGYDSSNCYDGKKLRFNLFHSDGLATYCSAFIRTEKSL